MEKKQLIEIICIIAGITLVIKAIDYLQFFITGFFQLLEGQGYAEFYYFFIYLTTIAIYFGASYLLIFKAKGISTEVSKRLDQSDILIDIDSKVAFEYAIVIIGGITFINGLSSFMTSIIRNFTMEGVPMIAGNMIWVNGLIKMIVGGLVIFKARALSGILKSKKEVDKYQ